MLHSASIKRGLRTLLKQQRLSSLTDTLRNMTALHAKKEWKSVLAIANRSDVLQFIERKMSGETPMWPNDRSSIATIFDSADNCDNRNISGSFIRQYVASGYDRYHLIASLGPDVATRLCFSYPKVSDPTELATITSNIQDTVLAPNLLLLNLQPPQVHEYLLAGHFHKYTQVLGEHNFGLLKQAFWTVLDSASDGESAKGITRRLLIQLMASKGSLEEARHLSPTSSSSSIPGQLTAAALQKVLQRHGLVAGTKFLHDMRKSVGLLSPDSMSDSIYVDMLSTLLSTQQKFSHNVTPSQSEVYLALLALLRLAAGNSAREVALRGTLLLNLANRGHYQEAVDLASLCVKEGRWLGSNTLNSLMMTNSQGIGVSSLRETVKSLVFEEQGHLNRLLDQAQSVLTAYHAGALILPTAVRSVRFMGQEVTANSPSSSTPRGARTCSSFELLLSEDEALLVEDGMLDFDSLLPPQDLVLGPNNDTIMANLLNIERFYHIDPVAHHSTAIRKLLEIINKLGDQSESEVPVTMNLLVRIARLGHATQSMLIVNKAVDLAFQLGELSPSHRRGRGDDIEYSWQLPQIGCSSTTVAADINVMPLILWEEAVRINHLKQNGEVVVEQAHPTSGCIEDGSEGGMTDFAECSQPTLEEIQMLLEVQIAVARSINSLTAMQNSLQRLMSSGVAFSERMARDAVSVLLFWGEHDSVQRVFNSLERTEGAQRVAQFASELLTSLLIQNRLQDAAKVVVIATYLQSSARQLLSQDPESATLYATYDALYAALHCLLRHLSLQSNAPKDGLDEGRNKLDDATALKAIVAVVVHSIEWFDTTQKLSSEAVADSSESFNPVLAVELLGQWLHLQESLQQPQRTAMVLEAVRGSVAQHPRGSELLRMFTAVADSTQQTEVSLLSADIFDAPLKIAPAKVNTRSGRYTPFTACTYDELEIRQNDSRLESHYLVSI